MHKREREREKLAPEELIDNSYRAWKKMPEKYHFTEEDEKNGLKDFLYGARDTAAKAVGNLFSELNIDKNTYQYLYEIPIGINKDLDDAVGSEAPDASEPGYYYISVGYYSDDISDFLDDDGSNYQKLQRRFAGTIAHEMIHKMQTDIDPSKTLFCTIGDPFNKQGWAGLEEGMAEALGHIAVKKQKEGWSLTETAKDLENRCTEVDMPATGLSARLIQKIKPDLLKWYITCTQTGDYRNNDKFSQLFGSSYDTFCQNLVRLYDYEKDKVDLSPDEKNSLIGQTAQIIDKATE